MCRISLKDIQMCFLAVIAYLASYARNAFRSGRGVKKVFTVGTSICNLETFAFERTDVLEGLKLR